MYGNERNRMTTISHYVWKIERLSFQIKYYFFSRLNEIKLQYAILSNKLKWIDK